MQNRLEDKLSMFEKVESFLQNNLTVLSNYMPILQSAYGDFKAKLDAILLSAQASAIDTTGYTEDKAAKRKALEQVSLKIARALTAYSSINKNLNLRAKINYGKNELEKMRDNDVYTHTKVIEEYANQYVSQLSPYGIGTAEVSDLAIKVQDFFEVIQTPKMKIEERSSYFRQLETQMSDADTHLKEVLDPLLGVIEQDEPLLYMQYKKARSIDQTGSQSSSKNYNGTIDANNVAVVATLPYDAGRTFTFKNTGNANLKFGLSTDGATIAGIEITVLAGAEIVRDSSDMHNEGDMLLVVNEEGIAGAYTVNCDG